tara:strand:+ start:65 stop:1192 length:1128 start_codon:yes stop_codon:yes gene_type:complete
MAFFNPKEDVIDIELTQHGKRLISKGKFKPVYYQFFDDDILYDVAHTYASPSANRMTELQNESEPRIQEETPRLRPQYSFISVDDTSLPTDNVLKYSIQKSEEKIHALPNPLGTSKIQSDYAPALSVDFWSGAISSSSDHLALKYESFTSDGTPLRTGTRYINIPQVNTDIIYRLKAMTTAHDPSSDIDSIEKIGQMGDKYSIPAESVDKDVTIVDFPDSTFLHIEHNYLLLEIGEENSPFLRENFDIEVFEIEDVYQRGAWKYDVLKPLYFAAKFPEYTDELLLDDSITYSATNFSELGPNYVEYFFDIEVDEEIDTEAFCRHRGVDRSKGLFIDRTFDCPDIIPLSSESIYGSGGPGGPGGPLDEEDGDICED